MRGLEGPVLGSGSIYELQKACNCLTPVHVLGSLTSSEVEGFSRRDVEFADCHGKAVINVSAF